MSRTCGHRRTPLRDRALADPDPERAAELAYAVVRGQRAHRHEVTAGAEPAAAHAQVPVGAEAARPVVAERDAADGPQLWHRSAEQLVAAHDALHQDADAGTGV